MTGRTYSLSACNKVTDAGNMNPHPALGQSIITDRSPASFRINDTRQQKSDIQKHAGDCVVWNRYAKGLDAHVMRNHVPGKLCCSHVREKILDRCDTRRAGTDVDHQPIVGQENTRTRSSIVYHKQLEGMREVKEIV